jgi:hypothetical protein
MPRLRQHNELSQVRALVAALALTVALSSCAAIRPQVAQPGVAFSLPVGGIVAINGSTTRITFDQVRYDARCAADEVCGFRDYRDPETVRGGDASLLFVLWRKGSPGETRILNLTPPRNETTWGDLKIRLEDLTPAPRWSNGYLPGHYVAQLVVNRT